jgi:hypothetical protein
MPQNFCDEGLFRPHWLQRIVAGWLSNCMGASDLTDVASCSGPRPNDG